MDGSFEVIIVYALCPILSLLCIFPRYDMRIKKHHTFLCDG